MLRTIERAAREESALFLTPRVRSQTRESGWMA
jgi:hypothetical protein